MLVSVQPNRDGSRLISSQSFCFVPRSDRYSGLLLAYSFFCTISFRQLVNDTSDWLSKIPRLSLGYIQVLSCAQIWRYICRHSACTCTCTCDHHLALTLRTPILDIHVHVRTYIYVYIHAIHPQMNITGHHCVQMSFVALYQTAKCCAKSSINIIITVRLSFTVRRMEQSLSKVGVSPH